MMWLFSILHYTKMLAQVVYSIWKQWQLAPSIWQEEK